MLWCVYVQGNTSKEFVLGFISEFSKEHTEKDKVNAGGFEGTLFFKKRVCINSSWTIFPLGIVFSVHITDTQGSYIPVGKGGNGMFGVKCTGLFFRQES